MINDDVVLPPGWAWGREIGGHGRLPKDIVFIDLDDAQPVTGVQFVAPGRHVLLIPGRTWPSEPEMCEDETGQGEWVADGQALVCPGCGLDCT